MDSVESSKYRLCVTSSKRDPQLVKKGQRLRFEVFNLEKREGLASAHETGLDVDIYDPAMHHLMVLDNKDDPVGTYRLWTGKRARKKGLPFYSASEFNMQPFDIIRDHTVEIGRACVHKDHRNGTVIGLLFQGLANYLAEEGARYLIGCSSLSLEDATDHRAALSAYSKLKEKYLVDEKYRTLPNFANFIGLDVVSNKAKFNVPPLLLQYLRMGAEICGPPAWDSEFRTYDFLTFIDTERMPEKYKHKFFDHSNITEFKLGIGHAIYRTISKTWYS